MKKSVLILDGVGVHAFALLPAVNALQDKVGVALRDVFDLIVSSGAASTLALGLATGKEPAEIERWYRECFPIVFPRPRRILRRPLGPLGLGLSYNPDPLIQQLQNFFGSVALADVPSPVSVVTSDFETYEPILLDNYQHQAFFANDELYRDLEASSASLLSWLHPALFRPLSFPFGTRTVEVLNTLTATSLALTAAHTFVGREALDDCHYVVLSTDSSRSLRGGDWGLIQWAPHLITYIRTGHLKYDIHALAKTVGANRFVSIEVPIQYKWRSLDSSSPAQLRGITKNALAYVNSIEVKKKFGKVLRFQE